ncbi:MAG: thiamine-phosphate kinase [Elusimicrobia bacterium]|nr:thiamine-phosphate kinase [Elusimicrobiota bacterium]
MGDDAFVADIRKGYSLVATKDMLIENVHFKTLWTTPFEIGYKSIAVNLSDLAAMGAAKPLYCLVGLGLPAKTPFDFVDKLYTGMLFASKKYNLKIVGGDTVSTKKGIVISITLIGEIEPKYVLKRSCAKVGDVLVVNAPFGDSGAGLFLLKKGLKGASKDEKYLIKKHLLPIPRLKEASLLAHSGKITSLIDSSDGLATSVKFITEESKVGAKIHLENIPISNQLKKICKKNKSLDPYDFALNGGEDYELVYTARPKDLAVLRKIMPSIQVIGEITLKKGIKYYLNGRKKEIKKTGFQHFK